jgi:hypothetical protein
MHVFEAMEDISNVFYEYLFMFYVKLFTIVVSKIIIKLQKIQLNKTLN